MEEYETQSLFLAASTGRPPDSSKDSASVLAPRTKVLPKKFLLRDWDPEKDLWHTCKKLDLVAVRWPACLHIVASGQGRR